MKYIPVLFLVILFACGQSNNDTKTTTDTSVTQQPASVDTTVKENTATMSIYDQYLPPALLGYVRRSVVDWELPDPSKWEKYWYDEYKKEKSLVNFISGDFNCDSATDYALILCK